MRTGHWLAIVAMLAACQCEKSPATPPSPTSTAPAGTPIATSTIAAMSPAPGASPAAEQDEDDDDDDMKKPWSAEFEIDGDANWYFGWAPMLVSFNARPLNGSPPYTYTWAFDDGSSEATGVTAQHLYTKPGTYNAAVTGKDGSGETYTVSFFIRVVSPEEYGETKGIDPALLPTSVPSVSPEPAATP